VVKTLTTSFLILECSLCLWTKTCEVFIGLHVDSDPLKPFVRLYPL
jgi:hypothetical protein